MNPVLQKSIAWENRRNHLNHDVLANRLMTHLVCSMREGHVSAESRMALSEWVKRVPDYRILLSEAPEVLSASNLLFDPACDGVPAEVLQRLALAAHALFLEGTGILALIAILESRLDDLEARLVGFIAESRGTFGESADSLYEAARALSEGISRLPHDFYRPIAPLGQETHGPS